MSKPDITNRQLVGVQDGHIVVLAPWSRMTKREAMVHAAWLLALSMGDGLTEWDDILTEVLNS